MAKALAANQVPIAVATALSFFNKWQRQIVIAGTSQRCVGIADGFSRSYCWGPQQYAVWMETADANRLFANEWERWQFLDITDTPSVTERPRMSKDDWRRLLASFAKLGRGRRLRPEYRSGAEAPSRLLIQR